MSQRENNTHKRKREHLNYEERKVIERMLREGANKGEIGRALYRNKSTIKREIKRGSVVQRRADSYQSKDPKRSGFIEYNAYYADVGQRIYEKHRKRCGGKSKVVACRDLVLFVEGKIRGKEKWSPDAAIGYAKQKGLFPGQEFSTKTFYNWIEAGLVEVKNIDLLLKVRRRPKKAVIVRKKAYGKSIEDRPGIVETREEFGHWEGDGIVGKAQQGQLITLVERKIGIGMLFDVGTRDSAHIVAIMDSLQERYGCNFSRIFKSITFDNGSEFADSTAMEQSGRTQVYYAHPYSSYERGTNENWNGMVRRFVPKHRGFETLTDKDIQRISHYINTLPRKRFGYRTPLDLWNEEMAAILTA